MSSVFSWSSLFILSLLRNISTQQAGMDACYDMDDSDDRRVPRVQMDTNLE